MKKYLRNYLRNPLVAAIGGLAMSAGAQAATMSFEHGNPDDFRDIRATDQGQSKFEEGVLREIEEQFQAEAAALPEGHTLQVTLKDVDLAGDVEYFHRWYPFGLRVIRNVDFPRMEFSYVYRDASGNVIREGEEEISDMSFRFNSLIDRTQEPLDYEKRLIHEWAKANLRADT